MVPQENILIVDASEDAEKSIAALYQLESRCDEILQKKRNCSFTDLLQLAKDGGFEIRRQKGSHIAIKHPTHSYATPNFDLISLQECKGKGKPSQIKQLVDFLQTAPKKTIGTP